MLFDDIYRSGDVTHSFSLQTCSHATRLVEETINKAVIQQN